MKPTDQDLEDRFHYHRPDAEAIGAHQTVTQALLDAARVIRDTVPEGRGLAMALTKIEEARMWANQGVAVDGTARRAAKTNPGGT